MLSQSWNDRMGAGDNGYLSAAEWYDVQSTGGRSESAAVKRQIEGHPWSSPSLSMMDV